MQRKASAMGAAAFLAVLGTLLAGCSAGDPGATGATGDAKPAAPGANAPAAPPGRYRTLPEPCSAVGHDTLDSMMPGIKAIPDERQRQHAYDGTAALTYATDRRVGCRWTGQSPDAADHLLVDFERVVSYDPAVSDDTRAQQIFTSKESDADVPGAPTPPGTGQQAPSGSPGAGEGLTPDSGMPDAGMDAGVAGLPGSGCEPAAPARPGGDGGPGGRPAGGSGALDDMASRTLNDLGDAAFLADACTGQSSAARHRTVTVVFRTSNVIVTVEYDEQPSRLGEVPDGKRMQNSAQQLARDLVGKLEE